MGYIIQEVSEKLARETAKRIENILQEYRNLCATDEDFSKRTLAVKDDNTTQYCFDGQFIFYTKFESDLHTISTKFYSGMVPGFLGIEVVKSFYANSKDQTE
jgi:hypothetical protein